MPKFETNQKFFFSLLGKKLSPNKLEEILPRAKAELDEWNEQTGEIKFELNDTNRPDLWSAIGLSRALKNYEMGQATKYSFFSTPGHNKPTGKYTLINEPSRPKEREYSVGFCAKGGKVTDELLKALIQLQDKICDNFGRRRKTIALGIYRMNLIHWPVHYTSGDPKSDSFVPLHETKCLTLEEVLSETEKGKEFGSIIKGWKKYPLLKDDSGAVLSMPPIINSNTVGSVEVGDSDLFVELSGPILDHLLLAANIVSVDMADLGFKISPTKVKFATPTKYGSEISVPFQFQTTTDCTLERAEKILGRAFTPQEAKESLAKMGCTAKVTKGVVTVFPPPWRNDFLCDVDVAEDMMIGYGLENFEALGVTDFTVGRLSKAEEFARKLTSMAVGMGFQEMIFNYLSSRKEFIDAVGFNEEKAVFIANPMSENFSVVRPTVISSLLKAEAASLHSPYPHKMFEVGKVCQKWPGGRDGLRTWNSFALFESSPQASYNTISSIVASIMFYLSATYTLERSSENVFIKGRQANIIVNGKKAGTFGEVNPECLEKWSLTMPSVALEIDADTLMEVLE